MIDILSGLKAGDSSCEKAMPGLENVPGSVAVTIVMAAALRASPFSYSKSCDTFRPRAAVAARPGLGGVGFIDFCKHSARLMAFMSKLRSE